MTFRHRIARRAGHALLARIADGYLEVHEDGSVFRFGSVRSELRARVNVRDAAAWSRIMRGSSGLAQGYADGLWESPDPVAVVRLTARNMTGIDRARRRLHPFLAPVQRLIGMVPRNTRRGARSNIAAHYDLGNTLFGTFLDKTMTYSCAYFTRPEATLEEAQVAKLDRICERLNLEPDDHLLEIGTGWGGLAIHAAQKYGCRVTTTTISREQREHAMARIANLGLQDRVTVLGRDYRDLDGKFDKLVSVEMIEAVGWQYFETFFRKCSALLRNDGLMLLQAITIDDELYEAEKASKSFANTTVFPGGCLPSERLIGKLVATHTDMSPIWADDITEHYAATLRLWRQAFNNAAPTLEPLGYDDRFQRMWNFYLAFSEGGFRERRIRDLQLLFAKPGFDRAASRASAAEPVAVA
ncbi:MAG: cyclopropane-fatty-acyl-phospholipid synthase family protein [Actinomycetota bacterium]|nr:cyclopropane-fatty-acyl-phospholipid synthase family protein [Actinomycetota bacterium]